MNSQVRNMQKTSKMKIQVFLKMVNFVCLYCIITVGHATTNEFYNEQFLSIKEGCYNKRGGILSTDVARACA
jgi:hypothetical protein